MGNDDDTIPTPYSLLFHPYLIWKDKLVSPLIDYLMGAHRLGISEAGTQEAKDALEFSRKFMVQSSSPSMLKGILKRWESTAECPLAETVGSIPFLPDVLHEWGIVPEGALLPEAAKTDRKEIGVTIRFPSSLLKEDCPTNVSEASGCVVVDFETIDWKTFGKDVPLVLQFHPGAFVVGNDGDVLLSEEIARLTENSTASNKDIINVCVDYALAPEHAFPVGIMDALSVVDFFLNQHKRQSIHFSGISAGANLALVAGMEGLRRFPGGKIASIQAQSPFCNPGADSLSYWMNKNVMPDIDFLRWGWRAYLSLEKDDQDDPETTSDLEKVLRRGSNHTSWKKWMQTYPKELHRLANPALDFPGKLNGDKTSAPTLIIRYNRGDPVHCDGKTVVETLKPMTGGNASFYESDGLHCDLFASYDVANPPECYKVWAEALFGSN